MQHGTAAWQKAAAQHGVGLDKTNETTSSYQQQSYTKQQQYSQQQQQHIQQQQQQSESSNQKPVGPMGTLLEMKKPVKSRFSSLPAAASTSNANTTTQQKLASSEAGGKGPAGDSMMPANWPTSLKMFVARSFSGCKTDEDRKNISQALEKLINKVAFENRVTTHKWELEDISASLIPKAKVAVAVPHVEAKPKALPSPVHASRPTLTTNFEIRDSDLKPKFKVAQKASYRPTIDTLDNTYGPGTYGASSSAGNGTQISYGGYGNGNGNGNGNGKVKQPYSPSFSPSSASASASAVENDKKRKSRWDLDSNSSNGDSMATVFPKSMKQFKNEMKHKSQKLLPGDHPASNSKKKESGSRIIEKPPTNAEQAMREKRASRFKESDVEVEVEIMRMPSLQSQSQILLGSKNRAKKRGSINNNYHSNEDKHNKNFSSSASDFDFESLIVIGTCQKLEKDYFRLTSAPIPNTVRPEDVLKRSLQLLKEKWNNASVEYVYMCSQFKSMRQDLTVQHIQNGELKSVLLLLVFTDLIV